MTVREACEVLVVGGGPAGTSTAVSLRRQGFDVMLVDRARFPRPKPCAEYLSPEASRILDSMGALAAIESTGAAQLSGVLVRAPNGATIRGEFIAGHAYTPYRQRGLSVRREVLDKLLVDSARASGVDVHEGARVTALNRRAQGGFDVEVMSDDARKLVRCRMVIGADGLHSVVANRLGLTRAARWPRRLALVTHYEGVADIGPLAEMHVEHDGFVGIADVGHGLTTVAMVVPAKRARELAGHKEEFLTEWLRSKPQLAGRFARARRVSPIQATGPFASQARRAWSDDALLVGDAADFFDPFTGEGIFAALLGGELAAAAAGRALGLTGRARRRALSAYETDRRRAFGGKWIVERVIAAVVANPWLINRAAKTLSRRRDMADLLIGVTGDFVPAREIVNARYVLTTFGVLG